LRTRPTSSCQETFQKLLCACLSADRLVRRVQPRSRDIRPAEKLARRNGDHKPVIGVATDIGASGRSTLYSYHQMWVANDAHAQPCNGEMAACKVKKPAIWEASE
jgi:hypothetical protein